MLIRALIPFILVMILFPLIFGDTLLEALAWASGTAVISILLDILPLKSSRKSNSNQKN
jgi:hypothetical protein